MKDAQLFKPHALAKAPIVSEGRLVRDLTMPMWDADEIAFYDSPTFSRCPAKVVQLNANRQRK